MKSPGMSACQLLFPYINRYWFWEDEKELPIMVPGTGTELFFQYGGSPISLACEGESASLLSESVLLQPRYSRFELSTQRKVKFISVRFRHGALRHFCPHPVLDLNDKVINAEDIWGREVREVKARILDSNSSNERIAVLEKFLIIQWLKNHKIEHEWFSDVINYLYYSENPDLDTVVVKSNLSTRYFQKIFKANSGVSPKRFASTARFERVLKNLVLNQRTDYLNVALEHGFYDQAHFIKSFKDFTGKTPGGYLQDITFRTHFYNQPLVSSS